MLNDLQVKLHKLNGIKETVWHVKTEKQIKMCLNLMKTNKQKLQK